MDEFAREFIAEAKEGMDMFDRDLLVLEKGTANPEIISGIFRIVHSIKGGCGFMGFEKLESLAHAGESLLSHMRDGTLLPAKEVITSLFKLSDAIRAIIQSLEAVKSEGSADLEPLIRELSSFQPDWVGQARPEISTVDPDTESLPASDAVPAAKAAVKPMEIQEGGAGRKDPASSGQTIRVDVSLLDKLMNLVGELVLVRNQVLRHAHMSGNAQLSVPSQHLNLITTELQEGVMKTRMQPIKTVLSKFPRIVRELSNSCGKIVHVEMVGEDTELDKTILEAIKDPLIHVLRNSIDHGIESPGLRESLGKPREGLILLKAFHLGGQVIIEDRKSVV